MRLYFLRHGIAEDRDRWPGKDFDRPLTAEGKERIALESDTIAGLELHLEVIVTSPLLRAFQTAEIVARKLKMRGKLVKNEALGPGFDVSGLAKILDGHPKAEAIMLVGHEPGFSATIGELIGGGRVVCKKGSLACVELESKPPLRGELLWLVQPRMIIR